MRSDAKLTSLSLSSLPSFPPVPTALPTSSNSFPPDSLPFHSHRQKNLAAKRLASQSPLAMSEILGIRSSANSPSPFPSPSPLGTPITSFDSEPNPMDNPNLESSKGELTTNAKLSVGDYFKQRMEEKRKGFEEAMRLAREKESGAGEVVKPSEVFGEEEIVVVGGGGSVAPVVAASAFAPAAAAEESEEEESSEEEEVVVVVKEKKVKKEKKDKKEKRKRGEDDDEEEDASEKARKKEKKERKKAKREAAGMDGEAKKEKKSKKSKKTVE
ncbi:hypothetical protein BDY24DRAFT_186590 [Mrakia frigida]|uniref:uncharacterized protein n=1 Tax=Mrakia frigida TaxID=29902 RepID=UPI003FCC22FA